MAEDFDQQSVEATNETETLDETQPDVTQDSAEGEDAQVDLEPEIAFSWQASEYVHHHKSKLWYVVLVGFFAGLAGIAIWLHLWLEIGVLAGAAGALAVYAHKPPRMMQYELSDQGVHIDGKLYSFMEFRSFGVIADEEWHSIDLEPVKRLSPRRVILFDSGDFDEIVSHLELHLPREDRALDLIERITRYVRF
jgi:hypothetical protein